MTAEGFEIETQLVLGAVKAGLEMREVPSYELVRRAGTSNLNAMRDGLRIVRTMLSRDLRRDATAATSAFAASSSPSGARTSSPKRASGAGSTAACTTTTPPATPGPNAARRNGARRSAPSSPTGSSMTARLRGRLNARRARHTAAPVYAVDSRMTSTSRSDA